MGSIVFVYGSLRKGMGNDRLLSNATFIGEGTLEQPAKMYSMGGFPILSFSSSEMKPNVRVEAYEVSPAELQRLDQLEGYRNAEDHWYNRSSKSVILDDGTVITGLIYHQDREFDLEVVENGDWTTHRAQGYARLRRSI